MTGAEEAAPLVLDAAGTAAGTGALTSADLAAMYGAAGYGDAAAAGAAGAGAGSGAGFLGLTGQQLGALGVSALGSGVNMYGQQQQANQRRDILNQQLTRTGQAADKAAQLVNAEGQSYQGDARDAALQSQQQATLAQSTRDLGSAPTIINGAGDAGAVSKDYLAAKDSTASSEGKRLSMIAEQLAKTRGVGQLLQTEGLRRADLAGTLQDMYSNNKNEAGAAQTDASNVMQPWWGQVGQAVGSGAAAIGAANAMYPSAGGSATGANAALTATPADTSAPAGFWNNYGSKAVRFGGKP